MFKKKHKIFSQNNFNCTPITTKMKKSLLKSIILFLSIPTFNSICFGIGTLLKSPTFTNISIEQFDSYHRSILLLTLTLFILILIIEVLHDFIISNHSTTTTIYIVSFFILAFLTKEQFTFRPFEHSLTFLCIASILVSRLYFKNNKAAFKRE